MSENRVQIVLEGDARSAQAAIEGTGKRLLDLSSTGEKASKSLKDADASTQSLGKTTQATGQALKQTDAASGSLSQSTQKLAMETGKAGAGLRSEGEAASALTQAVHGLIAAVSLYKAAEYAKDAVLQAARYETMGVVMHTVGNAAGYTAKQMDGYSEALQRQGISMLGSEESLARMIQGNIDLEKGVRLATASQGAAILMNRSSTEAFEAMTTAIATGLVINLHRMGVMADFEHSYAREAAALHKSKDELTERERVQARVNETLAKSQVLENVYAAAMSTAGKQLQTMVRYLSDFAVMTGSIGLETLTMAVFGTADALKATNAQLRIMMQDGTISTWSKNLATTFTELIKLITLATEVLGLFWLAWKGAVVIETAMLTLGLLKLELRSLAIEMAAAGGAWNYLSASVAASLPMLTTVAGALSAMASVLSGILIGKYLVDNFKWAAEASLSMGEAILTTWNRIIGEYKIGIASLYGEQEAAEKRLQDKLLTIRMTYLHERANLEKKFAPPEAKKAPAEILGNPGDQKALKSIEKANAAARKVQDAIMHMDAARNALAQTVAEQDGDELLIELAKLQTAYDKFVDETAKKLKDTTMPAAARSALEQALNYEAEKFRIQKDFAEKGIALKRAQAAAETQVQRDSLMGMDTYFADLEALQKKHAMAMLRPKSPEAMQSTILYPAQRDKIIREQEKKFQESSFGLEADVSKLRGEAYAGVSGHSAIGVLAEQATQVEIERKQKLLAINERLASVSATLVEIEAKYADAPNKQEELDRKAQELAQLEQYRDTLNEVSAAKQRDIAASRNWEYGARKGFQDYSDAAKDHASQAENAVRSAFGGMEDALASFVVKGKGGWSSLVDTILMDLVKIQMRSSITGPLSSWLGGFLPSANGNVLGGDGISALSGGVYSTPTFFSFDQHITAFARGGVLGEAGPEAVMPLTTDSNGRLSVHAVGGGVAPNVTINISIPASSGNQTQDKTYADAVGDSVQGALDTWWEDKYRQAHRPGAIGNGGMTL